MNVTDVFKYYFSINIWNNWYYFTLFALLLYGIYHYLLDSSITKKKESLESSIALYSIVAGNTFIITILTSIKIAYDIFSGNIFFGTITTMIFGLFQGLLFLFINVFRHKARDIFPQHYVMPIIRSSIIIVILFSWFALGELSSATPASFVGFFLVGLSIYLFKDTEIKINADEDKKTDKKNPEYIKGVIYLAMAVIVSAAIYLLAKYAVDPFGLNIFLFIFFANLSTCCVALYKLYSNKRKKIMDEGTQCKANHEIIRGFKTGLWLGTINLVAYACFLKSLSIGDASIIIPIYSLYVVIPVVLSTIIQGVKLEEKVAVGVVLSILAIIILRF